MPKHHRILALIYPDFETLDLFGPLGAIVPRSDYYTLKLANIHNHNHNHNYDHKPGAPPHGVESSIQNGIGTVPNLSLAEVLKEEVQFDTLFIPGGFGMMPLVQDAVLLQQIGQLVDRAANVFTVCTGSVLLAATGRLDGRTATTNKRLYDEMTPNCTLPCVWLGQGFHKLSLFILKKKKPPRKTDNFFLPLQTPPCSGRSALDGCKMASF